MCEEHDRWFKPIYMSTANMFADIRANGVNGVLRAIIFVIGLFWPVMQSVFYAGIYNF